MWLVEPMMAAAVFVLVWLLLCQLQLFEGMEQCMYVSLWRNNSPTASLTTNSNLSGTLCPGSVQFTCAVTQLTNLRWRFNDSISDVVVYALDSNRAPTFLLPGVTAQLVSVENTTDVVFADFTSTMTIDIAVLNSISSISCGSPAVTSVLTVPKFAVQGT